MDPDGPKGRKGSNSPSLGVWIRRWTATGEGSRGLEAASSKRLVVVHSFFLVRYKTYTHSLSPHNHQNTTHSSVYITSSLAGVRPSRSLAQGEPCSEGHGVSLGQGTGQDSSYKGARMVFSSLSLSLCSLACVSSGASRTGYDELHRRRLHGDAAEEQGRSGREDCVDTSECVGTASSGDGPKPLTLTYRPGKDGRREPKDQVAGVPHAAGDPSGVGNQESVHWRAPSRRTTTPLPDVEGCVSDGVRAK